MQVLIPQKGGEGKKKTFSIKVSNMKIVANLVRAHNNEAAANRRSNNFESPSLKSIPHAEFSTLSHHFGIANWKVAVNNLRLSTHPFFTPAVIRKIRLSPASLWMCASCPVYSVCIFDTWSEMPRAPEFITAHPVKGFRQIWMLLNPMPFAKSMLFLRLMNFQCRVDARRHHFISFHFISKLRVSDTWGWHTNALLALRNKRVAPWFSTVSSWKTRPCQDQHPRPRRLQVCTPYKQNISKQFALKKNEDSLWASSQPAPWRAAILATSWTLTPLNVPLQNGKPMPLQNSHFPTNFIKNEKVDGLQSWMNRAKVIRLIIFFMKVYFLYVQIPEMVISRMSYW